MGACALLMAAGALFSSAAPADNSSDEKLQQLLRRFPEADANHDGKLTADEFRAYREAGAGKRRPGAAAAAAPTTTPATTAPSRIMPSTRPAGAEAVKGIDSPLGQKGRLLMEERFDGDALPKGWTVKTGSVRVAEGTLHATQKKEKDGRLCLFNCEQPMRDMVIEIDFKFGGRGGLNVSVNPSAGELAKKGHLYSVMITSSMWNITEHNDKSDRSSQSKALAEAAETFEVGKWYTLRLENKGDDVTARIDGKKPLRATSKDFHVNKPGIEFRVLGRDDMEINFDNLRVWELE